MSDRRQNPWLALHLCFRRLQQKNRFMSSDLGDKLTTLESFLMIAIDSRPGTAIGPLADFYDVDQSTVSRSVAHLADLGFVRLDTSPSDKRSKSISLTAKGRGYIQIYDRQSNDLLAEYFANLNANEVKRITSYFHDLAEGAGTEEEPLRKNDHPFRSGMRRLTRTFGLLKPTYMGSTLSGVQWQVLTQVLYSPVPITPSEVALQLFIPSTTLSTITRILRSKGFLTQEAHSSDGRMAFLVVTEQGKQEVTRIEDTAAALIKDACRKFSSEEARAFLLLFEKVLGETAFGSRRLSDKYSWRRLEAAELPNARSYVVATLVKANQHHQLPEALLPASGFNFGLFCENRWVGVVGLAGSSGQADQTELAVIEKGVSAQDREQFVTAARKCACDALGLVSTKKKSPRARRASS